MGDYQGRTESVEWFEFALRRSWLGVDPFLILLGTCHSGLVPVCRMSQRHTQTMKQIDNHTCRRVAMRLVYVYMLMYTSSARVV